MEESIRCLKCGSRYIFEYSNTKIHSPVIHTNCPFCKEKIKMNLVKFVKLQVSTMDMSKYEIVKCVSAFITKLWEKVRC